MDKNAPLYIDYCSYQAAKYACENWHYSKCIPVGKLIKFGVWENGMFKGAVIFGRGACSNIGKPYRLKQTEICELVRVALSEHDVTVSKIVSLCLARIRKTQNIRMIVSYADPLQNHVGIIYQAMNWIYVGKSKSQPDVMYNGKRIHKKTAHYMFGTIKGLEKSPILWKHKYLYPLDKEMRQQIESLRKPYPKRAESIENDAHSIPVVTGRCDSDLGAPLKDNA